MRDTDILVLAQAFAQIQSWVREELAFGSATVTPIYYSMAAYYWCSSNSAHLFAVISASIPNGSGVYKNQNEPLALRYLRTIG